MNNMRFAFLAPLCSAALLGALAGCGSEQPYGDDGRPRIPVSGKVTFDGQPVDGGTITFFPKGDKLRPTGGPIVNGEYNVPAEKGGNEGTYQVRINWLKPTGKQVKDPDTGGMVDVMKESLPAKFNTASTLEANLTPDNTVHNFDLKSK